MVEKTRLSGKPIFIGRFIGVASTPGLNAVKEFVSGIDAGYVAQQITRMEAAVVSDPGLAIGTAKELVETCCKTILDSRGKQIPRNASPACESNQQGIGFNA